MARYSAAGFVLGALFWAVLLATTTGCAHYDAGAVRAAAQRYAAAQELTATECEEMDKTAARLEAGPDVAFYLLGRASELHDLADFARRRADQCRELVKRGIQDPELRAELSRSWLAFEEGVK